MAAIDRFILLIRDLRRNERGIALPTAMFAMIASMGLAGAAVVSSVDVQRGAKRDSGSKSAISAADAGANVATMRLSSYSGTLAKSPCIAESNGTLVESAPVSSGPGAGWCPPVSGTAGKGTYTYWMSPAGASCGDYALCIVSVGTVGGVSRRIEMTFEESVLQDDGSSGGEEEEEGGTGGTSFEGLIGQDSLTITGSADIQVGVGTNGEVLGENKSAKVCGDIRVGVGKPAPKVQQCSKYTVTKRNVDLPPVTTFMPANIATSNANHRLTTCKSGKPTGCQTDGFTGNWNKEPFNAGTKTLTLSSSDALTLSGPDYWFCKLKMSGSSQLIMRAGAKVRIFFNTPEKCGMSPGATQIEMTGSSRITATGYGTTPGSYDMPGFYMLGSGSAYIAGNNGSNEMIIYAPDGHIELKGSAIYKGLMAAKTLKVTGSGTVLSDAGFQLPPELQPPPKTGEEENEESVTTARLFTPQTFVECTGLPATGQAPNASC